MKSTTFRVLRRSYKALLKVAESLVEQCKKNSEKLDEFEEYTKGLENRVGELEKENTTLRSLSSQGRFSISLAELVEPAPEGLFRDLGKDMEKILDLPFTNILPLYDSLPHEDVQVLSRLRANLVWAGIEKVKDIVACDGIESLKFRDWRVRTQQMLVNSMKHFGLSFKTPTT